MNKIQVIVFDKITKKYQEVTEIYWSNETLFLKVSKGSGERRFHEVEHPVFRILEGSISLSESSGN